MMPIASVPRLWPEATIVCIGSGPSLTPEDISYLWVVRQANVHLRVIVINDSWRLCRWADVLYAPDARWWGWHAADVAQLFAGRKYTLDDSNEAAIAGVERLNYKSGLDVSDDPSLIYTGGHAGYQAPQLAVHFGARKIVLLGYDLQPSADGRHHFFGDHPDGSHLPYDTWVDKYQTLMIALSTRSISIVNASRATAITAIPRMSLAVALSR